MPYCGRKQIEVTYGEEKDISELGKPTLTQVAQQRRPPFVS
jgi:hypothetical protein